MNIREIVNPVPNYYEINREERNYAAILFAALCKNENVAKFLKKIEIEHSPSDEFGIYFEYAYLRDIWYLICDDDVKKEIIRENLDIKNIEEILKKSTYEINRFFGVGGTASSEYIEFPGKWSIVKYQANFQNSLDFLKVCKFKWSFNIKPDIVIHLDKSHAICIEAKYESGEGQYPASTLEKEIFRSKALSYVGQMELQKYMMEELLGIKTEFMFLVSKKERSETHKVISWKDAFECLDISEMPYFAKKMANKISGQE